MNSYRPDSTDPHNLARNQEIAEQHMDDVYNTRFLAPGLFVPFGGSLHGTAGQSVGLGKFQTVDFPDALTTYATATIYRPAYWLRGNFKVTVLYTAQVAGTANFSLLAVLGGIPKLGNYSTTGITVFQSVAINAPGPTVADDEKEQVFYTSTAQVTQQFRLIFVRIGRAGGADANNNEMQLTGVVVEFIPARTVT